MVYKFLLSDQDLIPVGAVLDKQHMFKTVKTTVILILYSYSDIFSLKSTWIELDDLQGNFQFRYYIFIFFLFEYMYVS